ncbi:DUF1983 domain-containing protein [Erwinia pyri]|uniref:DUF1983 domain-containing protein n=1 Tax=Erwinia pyri TaxID=3062598 RepID=A0AA50DI31_9GAMM|nr:DUF1983 domain-containing protein [Erwinia sp. DE2]WLS77357.1 DUF1983 domain-containing protein [Erwinia sp. DE2]
MCHYNLTSSVNQKLTATINADGAASAFYDVGLQILRNGQYFKTGMAMGIEPAGSSYKSTIAFNADQFGIYTGSSAGDYQLAFAALNGQVFLRSAFIQDGSIDNAKIGHFIQSNNYVAGSLGWRMDKGGTFENNGSDGTGRMVQNNTSISVYDANGTLRVKMGKLS